MAEADQKVTFCADPESPINKWKTTNTNNPDNRTYYAGEVIAIARKLMGKAGGSA